MRFDNVTIKDIARALNLSTSTVSRALRGSYEISPETKKLVMEYAEKINYRPNPIALSLKERRSRSIGVIVSEIANNFFSEAINGIEAIAYNKGYHVIITQTHESYEREKINVQHLASRSVDGLLVSMASETVDISHLKELHQKGLPIVFFDRICKEIETHKVTSDNYLGAFRATEHLIGQGFQKIAHITSSSQLSITKERLEGYKAALQKHGLPYDESLVKHCRFGGVNEIELENALAILFASVDKPDAIFSASDRLTVSCLRLLRELPAENSPIGMVGFSNINLADLFYPTLTTVRQPAFEIGQTAIELLIQIIESKRPVTKFETRVMENELTVRGSSVRKENS